MDRISKIDDFLSRNVKNSLFNSNLLLLKFKFFRFEGKIFVSLERI